VDRKVSRNDCTDFCGWKLARKASDLSCKLYASHGKQRQQDKGTKGYTRSRQRQASKYKTIRIGVTLPAEEGPHINPPQSETLEPRKSAAELKDEQMLSNAEFTDTLALDTEGLEDHDLAALQDRDAKKPRKSSQGPIEIKLDNPPALSPAL
jgi:hypothetical protein